MIVCGIWPSICSSAFGREWRKAVVVAAISTDTHISVKVSLGARNTQFSLSSRYRHWSLITIQLLAGSELAIPDNLHWWVV